MKIPWSRLAHSSVTHVAFAFLGMGSWATFANCAHPLPAPILAGLVQGTISGCLTLFLKRTVAYLGERFDHGPMAILAPPAIASMASASLLVAIHTISRTPEIGKTIALPLTIASSYAVLYNFTLWRAGNHGER